jgi:hypothetical protein
MNYNDILECLKGIEYEQSIKVRDAVNQNRMRDPQKSDRTEDYKNSTGYGKCIYDETGRLVTKSEILYA